MGGVTGGATVWFRVVGNVGGKYKNGGGNSRRLPPEDHGEMAWRTTNGTRETPAAGEVLKADGIQTSAPYIGRMNETVVQWVDLYPIFEVCTREHEFEGGGPWWRQAVPEEVPMETLAEDLRKAYTRRERQDPYGVKETGRGMG